MNELIVLNRQRTRRVDLALLRRTVRGLLKEIVGAPDHALGIHLVEAREMARINAAFLHHEGSTDVITFDYGGDEVGKPDGRNAGPVLHGEIFVCVDDALTQARRFRTTWQCELVRYVAHGVLHLLGHDDSQPSARRRMKREEDRVVRELTRRFPLSKLARKPTVAP